MDKNFFFLIEKNIGTKLNNERLGRHTGFTNFDISWIEKNTEINKNKLR